jgi:hypothetical protein
MNSKLENLIIDIDDGLSEDAVYLSSHRSTLRGFENFDASLFAMMFMVLKMLYESMCKGMVEGFGHGLGKSIIEGASVVNSPTKLTPASRVEDATDLDELFIRVCELGGSMSTDRLDAFLQGGKLNLQKYFEEEKGVPKENAARMAEVYMTCIHKVLLGER